MQPFQMAGRKPGVFHPAVPFPLIFIPRALEARGLIGSGSEHLRLRRGICRLAALPPGALAVARLLTQLELLESCAHDITRAGPVAEERGGPVSLRP
jgi:hypothetical protein